MNSDKIGDSGKFGKNKVYAKREPIVSQVSDIDFSGTYSYANYLRWQFDGRLELIKGKVFELRPELLFIRFYNLIYLSFVIWAKYKKGLCWSALSVKYE